MRSGLDFAERKVARIRALVSRADVREYVMSVLDRKLADGSDNQSMGIVPQPLIPSQKLLASARFAAEYLDDPAKILSRPEGIVDLGTIEWCLRPSLPVRAGKFAPPTSPPWNELNADSLAIPSRHVCRIDLGFAGSDPFHLGTGFVAGSRKQDAYIIVTNAHVASEAVRLGWPTDSGLRLYCDFDRTSVEHEGQLHQMRRGYTLHDRYDLAALYLTASEKLTFLDQGNLRLSVNAPSPTVGATIGVLGHPHFDSRRDPFPQHFGFGDQYGIKRFSPGFIRALEDRRWLEHNVEVFLHDATTLSGSSGSCILNLQSQEVLGLHFGGWPAMRRTVPTPTGDLVAQLFEANGAVPLWNLAGDPILELVK